MVAHQRRLPLERRQVGGGDPILTSTVASGISGVITASTVVPTGPLVFNSANTNTPTPPLPPVVNPSTTASTLPASTSAASTPLATSSGGAVDPSKASSKNISLSTVIGSCVGAFIGASALILFGIWSYKRYSKSLSKRSRSRGPHVQNRNIRGNQDRRKSKLEPWNKLDEEEDQWEGKYHTKETKEVDQVAPMEKLTMFKKTPSVRTAWTHNPAEDTGALQFPQSFAPFDPNLAQTLTFDKPTLPEPRPVVGRVDANPTISWDAQTSKDSFLTVHSNLRSSGAMSPTLNMAIPTPPAVVTEHKWESAEVVNFPAPTQPQNTTTNSNNPFFNLDNSTQDEQQTTPHNPFFGATKDYQRSRSNSISRSRSGSMTRSRSSSLSTTVPEVPLTKSAKAKGKERMRYSQATVASQATVTLDPFADIQSQLPPRPQFVQHVHTGSVSSTESKERALQSLVAALDLPESEVRDRLRIASMQPSIISQASAASTIGPDVDEVARSFPLPPSSGGLGGAGGGYGRP